MGLDDDLIAYYEAEARAGRRSRLAPMRTGLRERFVVLLRGERRERLVDVGAGPGLDAIVFQQEGFVVTGVDLAVSNAVLMRNRGVASAAGSLFALPFPDATFDALWTMSTFVHVPRDRLDVAMSEMLRVVVPGGPLAIGTWGGRDFEGVPELGDLRPPRFFSLSAHDAWCHLLGRHADIDSFETFPPAEPSGWEYQFAVLRRR